MTREISCREASRYVFRYLDGELEPKTEAEFDAHLRQCRKCMGVIEFERRVIDLVRRSAGSIDEAPDSLRARVERILAFESGLEEG